MHTYCLKYGNDPDSIHAVGVSDMKMAVDVLEARISEERIEVWHEETRICCIDPRGDGLWLVSR